MREYRNGELVGYGDEVVVVSRKQYEQDDYSSVYEYDTVAQACEDIESGDCECDAENICVVRIEEYYDGTDYTLMAEYRYNEESEQYESVQK